MASLRDILMPDGRLISRNAAMRNRYGVAPEVKQHWQSKGAELLDGLREAFGNPDGTLKPLGSMTKADYPGPSDTSFPVAENAASKSASTSRFKTEGPPRPPGSIPLSAPVPTAVMMQKLQAAGFNPAQSAALIGNMKAESSLIPNNVNSKEGAHGLIQWRDQRFTDLQNYAAKQGTHWSNPDAQIGFIKHEMTAGKERQNGARFLNATTVEEANAGLKRYIRYGDQTESKRLVNSRLAAGGRGDQPGAASAYVAEQKSRVAGKPAVQAIEQAVGGKAPAARQNAPAGRAAPTAGGVVEAAARGPSQPSKLAAGIIAGYGPQGTQLSTYIEPATGNEILTGSVGGDSIFRNLGPNRSAQQAPQTATARALAPAVKAATEQPSVPMPRPRPPGASLGQTEGPVTPFSYYGAQDQPGTGKTPGASEFNPTPAMRQKPELSGGQLDKLQPMIPDQQVEQRAVTPSSLPGAVFGTNPQPAFPNHPGSPVAPLPEPGFTPGAGMRDWGAPLKPPMGLPTFGAPTIGGYPAAPAPPSIPPSFPGPSSSPAVGPYAVVPPKGDLLNMAPKPVPTTTITPPPPQPPPLLQWWQQQYGAPGGGWGGGGWGGGSAWGTPGTFIDFGGGGFSAGGM